MSEEGGGIFSGIESVCVTFDVQGYSVQTTLLKKKRSGARPYMTNFCAFSDILGSPSSYMTLHPIPSDLPFI